MMSDLIGLILLFIFPLFIALAMWLVYMIHAYTEKAEALLPNSSFVRTNRAAFFHMGIMGKAIRNGVLTMVLLTPAFTAKRNIVDLAEVEKFPKRLKLILVGTWGLGWFLVIILMTLELCLTFLEA
ncbi:hypothetical protein PS712_02399 [Pseudomonas fluorescens]|uniref:Uncharacterized protein n=2 Tax=Pseudomonas fluorescens TaxID=294 RepID=A0A5E7C0T8_PSEFL|nr:hypothetical protein PS712_02399 [Pseudomonas fluorescens]